MGLLLASVGMVIGLGAAVPLTRLISSFLFGIQPLDPLSFIADPALARRRIGQLSAGAPGIRRSICGSFEGGVERTQNVTSG